MITRGIREFMARDWKAARACKDRYWGERIRRMGPLEGLRVADQLWRQAIRQHAGWPDAARREEDLLSHERLAQRFRRADAARRP